MQQSHSNSVASPPSDDGAAAEQRLREAEERLREAIEELQRRQRRAKMVYPACDHGDETSCVANAIGNLCQSFLLSYGVRVGIGILLRAFKLARRKSYSSLLDLKQLVSEKDLIVREEACRVGLLFGGFTGSYHALRCLLRKWRKKETPFNVILAGSIASLSILALDDPNRRRTLALYLLARLAQCAYNSAKSKNKFHFWGSSWRHGDSLLFALSCAQVMYAFVMRPESLPKSYQDFIQKTGPVAKPVYKAVRECCRGSPVDVASLSSYLSTVKGADLVALQEFPSIIPCSVIHPGTKSCLAHNAYATSATFRKTFPLYFSLTFVPFVVLRLQKFMEAPFRTSWYAVTGAVRSTAFLSSFVGIFQGAICLHRKAASQDHKLNAEGKVRMVDSRVMDLYEGATGLGQTKRGWLSVVEWMNLDGLVDEEKEGSAVRISGEHASRILVTNPYPTSICVNELLGHEQAYTKLNAEQCKGKASDARSYIQVKMPGYEGVKEAWVHKVQMKSLARIHIRLEWHNIISSFPKGAICLHRKAASQDHKLVYWFAGGLAALSVLLEKKGRRGELGLYVLPRAGESLWYILVNRRVLPDIKNAEVALFCACMGGMMYYLEHEPDTMSPFLRSLIRRFLASRISNPAPPSTRNPSYNYLQTLDAIKKPTLQNQETELQPSEKYNLESIPGL
ncbi:mitochondrial inner membrane translocase subunit [Tanacetum coccineum]